MSWIKWLLALERSFYHKNVTDILRLLKEKCMLNRSKLDITRFVSSKLCIFVFLCHPVLCVKIFNIRPYRYMGPVTQGEALGYLLPLQERFPGITSHLELQMCDGTDPSPFTWPRYPLIFYTVVTFLMTSHHSIYSWPSKFNMTTDFLLSPVTPHFLKVTFDLCVPAEIIPDA